MSHAIKAAVFTLEAVLFVAVVWVIAPVLQIYIPAWFSVLVLLLVLTAIAAIAGDRAQYFLYAAILGWAVLYPVSDGIGSFPIWVLVFIMVHALLVIFCINRYISGNLSGRQRLAHQPGATANYCSPMANTHVTPV